MPSVARDADGLRLRVGDYICERGDPDSRYRILAVVGDGRVKCNNPLGFHDLFFDTKYFVKHPVRPPEQARFERWCEEYEGRDADGG